MPRSIVESGWNRALSSLLMTGSAMNVLRRTLRRYRSYRWGETELRLIRVMTQRDKLAIDVGGYDGEYTLILTQYARRVLTFEPNPRKVERLREEFKGTSVEVFPCALSDTSGKTTLYLPLGHDRFEGCATLDRGNPSYGQGIAYEVEMIRLDELRISEPIGAMKVDVEGHELAVLRGGQSTLERDRPNLVIEAEERHRKDAVATLRDFLTPMGYRGFFVFQHRLFEVEVFAPAIHQRQDRVGTAEYAANFLWSADPEFGRAVRSELDQAVRTRSRLPTMWRALAG